MDDPVPRNGDVAAHPRQTLGYIRHRLGERGLAPKSKLGQNFLIDLNLIDLVIHSAELSREDLILEVGSGTGSLTAKMVEQGGAVLGVEIDPQLFPLVSELLSDHANLRLLNIDALRRKNELAPEIFASLAALSEQFGTTRFKLVANLPYAVATPVIANLLLSDWVPERMVVTVQWEIAERMMAGPGESQYGALAVLTQSLADVSLVRKLPPNVFWPRPQVDSAIVMVRPLAAKREHVGDPQALRTFLRDLYVHRRKNLRGALAGWPTGRRDKAAVDRMLATLGIDGTRRAEELDLEQHLRLSQAFAELPA